MNVSSSWSIRSSLEPNYSFVRRCIMIKTGAFSLRPFNTYIESYFKDIKMNHEIHKWASAIKGKCDKAAHQIWTI